MSNTPANETLAASNGVRWIAPSWLGGEAGSAVIETTRGFTVGDLATATYSVKIEKEFFSKNFSMHRRMIAASSVDADYVRPVAFLTFSGFTIRENINSSDSLYGAVAEYYSRIERQLSYLKSDDDEGVEEGAVNSAMAVVTQLKSSNLAPPAISSHGGDAVVMLWAMGDTTYAITVTDGEIGYVVRRNKKVIRIADSINLSAFRLADLR